MVPLMPARTEATRLTVHTGKCIIVSSLSQYSIILLTRTSGYYTAPTGTGAANPYGYPTTGTATNY